MQGFLKKKSCNCALAVVHFTFFCFLFHNLVASETMVFFYFRSFLISVLFFFFYAKMSRALKRKDPGMLACLVGWLGV